VWGSSMAGSLCNCQKGCVVVDSCWWAE